MRCRPERLRPQLVWNLGTITGSVSGRTQDPYLPLEYTAYSDPPDLMFSDFSGTWAVVGQGVASAVVTYGTSWSGSRSTDISNAWKTSMDLAVSTLLFEDPVPPPVKITQTTTASEAQTHTNSQTVTATKGGKVQLRCTSLDCTNGVLYQWQVSGQGNNNLGTQFVTECSWVRFHSSRPCRSRRHIPQLLCTVGHRSRRVERAHARRYASSRSGRTAPPPDG